MQFKSFLDLNEVEKVLVYGWRNHLKIAPFMRRQTISLRGHLAFLETLKGDESKRYFLLVEGDEILGVVCFVDINFGISCEFGIYQNPDLRGNGTRLMEAMLEYAKNVLQVAKIYACALNCNTKAITLYAKFGFTLTQKDATMSYFELSTLEIPTPAGGGDYKSLVIILLQSCKNQDCRIYAQESRNVFTLRDWLSFPALWIQTHAQTPKNVRILNANGCRSSLCA